MYIVYIYINMELLVSNLVGVNTIHATSLVKSTFLFCPFTSPEIGLIDWCNDRFGLVGHVLVYIVPLSIRIYSSYNLNRSFLRVQLGQQKVKHGQAN